MPPKKRNDHTEIRAKLLELASRPSGVLRAGVAEYGYSLDDVTIALKYASARGLVFSLRQPNTRVFRYFTSEEARDAYFEETPVAPVKVEVKEPEDQLDDLTVDPRSVNVDFSNAKITIHPWSMSDPYRAQPPQAIRKGASDFLRIKSLGIDASGNDS
jgi:hypothetical protein